MPQSVNIEVYSDYICPWCYVAAARLKRLKEEYGDKVSIIWRSFPLRVEGMPMRMPLAQYIPYTNQSRARAEREEPGLRFEPLTPDVKLPDSTIPAHEAAKCAALQGEAAFERYHWALLQANFSELKDISDREVLISIAKEVGLDVDRFVADLDSGEQRARVISEFEKVAEGGWLGGIPTVVFNDKAPLEGAVPIEMYRQAVSRMLSHSP